MTLLDLADRAEVGELGVATVHDGTGLWFEMEPKLHPVVARLIDRLEELAGVANAIDSTLRFRRYHVAERHPIHTTTTRSAAAGSWRPAR